MDGLKGRPDHIEDVLIRLHSGQWFGWADSNKKVYSGLEIYPVDGVTHPKPTKQELNDALAAAQATWDGNDYARQRRKAYSSTADQLDMLWHDFEDGTTTWRDHVRAVKQAYPKP